MYCIKCGHEVKDGAKFCESCGNPVGGQSVGNNTSSTQKIPVNKSAVTMAILVPVIGIILFILFLIAICFFAYSIYVYVENEIEYTDEEMNSVELIFDVTQARECGISYNFTSDIKSYEYKICEYDDLEDDVEYYYDYMMSNYEFVSTETDADKSIKSINTGGVVITISVYIDERLIVYEYDYSNQYSDDSYGNTYENLNNRKYIIESDKYRFF